MDVAKISMHQPLPQISVKNRPAAVKKNSVAGQDSVGAKQYYDTGLHYDSGLYYDRWGENPKQSDVAKVAKSPSPVGIMKSEDQAKIGVKKI